MVGEKRGGKGKGIGWDGFGDLLPLGAIRCGVGEDREETCCAFIWWHRVFHSNLDVTPTTVGCPNPTKQETAALVHYSDILQLPRVVTKRSTRSPQALRERPQNQKRP